MTSNSRLAARDLLDHSHVMGKRIDAAALESQGARHASHEIGPGHGVAAGEQRHVVTIVDELLGEKRDHPFRSTIELGRDTLGERGHLSNS